MASHPKNYVLVCCALLVLLQVQHYFELVEGSSRLSKFHPTITSSPPTPPQVKLQKLESPSIDGYMAKKYELTAFRPTSPGHSPGIGHDEPPGSL
nr:transmembrane protein, putative [Ipomoea batatas]GMD82039.1 transmembrane protein, putative [Ipomoea batatas]